MKPEVNWVRGNEIPRDWEGKPVWRWFPSWNGPPECAPFYFRHHTTGCVLQGFFALAEAPEKPNDD